MSPTLYCLATRAHQCTFLLSTTGIPLLSGMEGVYSHLYGKVSLWLLYATVWLLCYCMLLYATVCYSMATVCYCMATVCYCIALVGIIYTLWNFRGDKMSGKHKDCSIVGHTNQPGLSYLPGGGCVGAPKHATTGKQISDTRFRQHGDTCTAVARPSHFAGWACCHTCCHTHSYCSHRHYCCC